MQAKAAAAFRMLITYCVLQGVSEIALGPTVGPALLQGASRRSLNIREDMVDLRPVDLRPVDPSADLRPADPQLAVDQRAGALQADQVSSVWAFLQGSRATKAVLGLEQASLGDPQTAF